MKKFIIIICLTLCFISFTACTKTEMEEIRIDVELSQITQKNYMSTVTSSKEEYKALRLEFIFKPKFTFDIEVTLYNQSNKIIMVDKIKHENIRSYNLGYGFAVEYKLKDYPTLKKAEITKLTLILQQEKRQGQSYINIGQ